MASNQHNPLLIIPPEIWELIFNNLDDPQDLVNLLLASPLPVFNDVLKRRKPTFLAPLVLPIFLQSTPAKTFLTKSEYLGLRFVSSQWRDSFDKHLQTDQCVRDLGDHHDHRHQDPVHDSQCWLKQTNMTFHEPRQLELLVQRVGDYGGECPFITRSLFVGDHGHHDEVDEDEPEQPPRSRMWPRLLALLTKYGEGLHSFECFSTAVRTAPQFYGMLHQALLLLPNLRKLQLNFYVQPGDILKERMEELLKDSSRPLPPLPKLSHLKISQVPSVLLNGILAKYSSQLKKLSLVVPSRQPHLYTFNEAIPLPALTYLSIPIRYDHQILALEKSNWLSQLKTLVLRRISYCFVVKHKSNLEKLFEMIATKTSAALTDLTLGFSTDMPGEEKLTSWEHGSFLSRLDPRLRLNSLSIQNLTITADSFNLNTIDFILGLGSSLKHFHVIFTEVENVYLGDYDGWSPRYEGEETRYSTSATQRPERKQTYGTIRWFGYWSKMYESNIWDLMPKLVGIQLEFRVVRYAFALTCSKRFQYTRRGWREHKASKDIDDDDESKWHWQNFKKSANFI